MLLELFVIVVIVVVGGGGVGGGEACLEEGGDGHGEPVHVEHGQQAEHVHA